MYTIIYNVLDQPYIYIYKYHYTAHAENMCKVERAQITLISKAIIFPSSSNVS